MNIGAEANGIEHRYLVDYRVRDVLVQSSVLQHSKNSPGTSTCIRPSDHVCGEIYEINEHRMMTKTLVQNLE